MVTVTDLEAFVDRLVLRSRRLAIDDWGGWGVRHFEEVGAGEMSLMNLWDELDEPVFACQTWRLRRKLDSAQPLLFYSGSKTNSARRPSVWRAHSFPVCVPERYRSLWPIYAFCSDQT